MTYAWQKVKSFTSKLFPGQYVELNPAWSGYTYLRKEFGHLFPRSVDSHDAFGIVKLSNTNTTFARQCLRARGQ